MANLPRVTLFGARGYSGRKVLLGLKAVQIRGTWDWKDIWSHLQWGRTASLLRNVISWSAYVLQRHLK